MAALAVLTLCFGDLHHRLGFFSERAELRFPKMAVGTTYILLGAPSHHFQGDQIFIGV